MVADFQPLMGVRQRRLDSSRRLASRSEYRFFGHYDSQQYANAGDGPRYYDSGRDVPDQLCIDRLYAEQSHRFSGFVDKHAL